MFNFTQDMVDDLHRYLDLYYLKIIHIDLADDSFKIVLMSENEPKPETDNIREWFSSFLLTYVHPDDRQLFQENTIKDLFYQAMENESINFTYRRKAGDDYELVRLIFIPDGKSETTGYVFIKYAN